jgi:hypothetical protein
MRRCSLAIIILWKKDTKNTPRFVTASVLITGMTERRISMASFPIYHPASDWKIYYKMYRDGAFLNSGTYWKSYKHKSSAIRAARGLFDKVNVYPETGEIITYTWTVGQSKPEEE